MNRTIKDATVKRYYYKTHEQVKRASTTLSDSLQLCSTAQDAQGIEPYEYIVKCWQNEKERFKLNPNHHTLGLNT